jgi:hypothetical protein
MVKRRLAFYLVVIVVLLCDVINCDTNLKYSDAMGPNTAMC